MNLKIILFIAFQVIAMNFVLAQNPLTCPDTLVINSYITTYGFKAKDVDTIKVKIYTKGSNFRQPKDSFYVYSKDFLADTVTQKRFIDIGKVRRINNTMDWEMVLRHNQVFRISDIQTEMVLVRNQFKRCQMVSFNLNGKPQTGAEITIVKKGFKKVKEKKMKEEKGRKHLIL